jgi:hypothetical protein
MTVQLMNSMPCRVKAAHLILQPSERCKGEEDGLARVVRAVRVGLGQKVMVHCGDSTSSILEKLQPFGLLECSLPPILGGSWKYEEVSNWQQLRAQFEGGSIIEAFHDAKNQSPLCATEDKKRRNLMDRICSRRKRERRRCELGLLLQHTKAFL